nr:GIY-YIG nuclease family protein [Candidatus Sigynarchaeota archaeon]
MALAEKPSFFPKDPGVYILCIVARESLDIPVGKLGIVHVKGDCVYLYVGSALKGLHGRLARHLSRQGKKIHWHVDFLLEQLDIHRVYYAITSQKKECEVSMRLHAEATLFKAIERFGNSDCKSCPSHLYQYLGKENIEALDTLLRAVFEQSGLSPVSVMIERFEPKDTKQKTIKSNAR